MHPSRRRFLQTMAGTASLGLADLAPFRGFAALGAAQPAAPERVQFGPDIEPIVRLIEETPHDKVIAALVEQLRGGLPYRRFLAATFFYAVRRQGSAHEVFLVHSVNQLSQDIRPEERLLPLFWAVGLIKWRSERWPSEGLMPPLMGKLPPAEKAAADYHEAMQRYEPERAELALVALARNQGTQQIMEHLWLDGCSNLQITGGHRAIAVANCCRTLDTVGWQHAEPALRGMVQYLLNIPPNFRKPDTHFQANAAHVDRNLGRLPPGWAAGKGDQAATLELFGLIRTGKSEPACELAVKQLLGGTGAQALWDAVHLSAAEGMVRFHWTDLVPRMRSRPLHSNTFSNALHYAFRSSTSARTRLLALLQSIAGVAENNAVMGGYGALRDILLTKLPAAELPAKAEDAVAEIFALVPARAMVLNGTTKRWDDTYGKREAADEACRKVFVLAKERPAAVPLFLREARSWLCQKAVNDSHEFKFAAAILEDLDWVSPEWRPHLLAASVHWLHGKQSPDAVAIQQAREALEKKG